MQINELCDFVPFRIKLLLNLSSGAEKLKISEKTAVKLFFIKGFIERQFESL